MGLVDTTPVSVITAASLHNFSVEEKNRREAAIKNKDFFFDRHKQHLNLINMDVDPVMVNLVAPVVKKKVNLLYSRPLVREYEGPSASISFIEKFYEQMKIDDFLRHVDWASELTGTGLVFVGRDEDGEIVLRMFDASEFSVVESEDDFNIPDAVSLTSTVTKLEGNDKQPLVSRHVKTQVWTNEYVTDFVDEVRKSSEANDLGFVPFIQFKGEEVYGQFLGHAPATSVVLMNEDIDQQLTNLGYMMKMQSATPIVLEGFSHGEGLVVHPGKAISVPAGASATALQLNPKIEESLAEIKYLEEKLYETSSVPKVTVVGDQQASSGRELAIKWYPIIQVYRDKATRYNNYELNLANMILQVEGLELLESIDVHYPEEKLLPLSSDMEELVEEMNLGLTTPIDEMQKRDPSLSEGEAEAQVRANKDFNKQVLEAQSEEGEVQPDDDKTQKED